MDLICTLGTGEDWCTNRINMFIHFFPLKQITEIWPKPHGQRRSSHFLPPSAFSSERLPKGLEERQAQDDGQKASYSLMLTLTISAVSQWSNKHQQWHNEHIVLPIEHRCCLSDKEDPHQVGWSLTSSVLRLLFQLSKRTTLTWKSELADVCQADDISYSIIIFFSSIAAFHVALLFLLLPFLVGACKTLTALSRLFVCQPLPLLCNLGGLQGPRGQGTLNTDSMCDVCPLPPCALPKAG